MRDTKVKRITVRITPRQAARIATAGTMARGIRQAIDNASITDPVELRLSRVELARVGTNLNQIARRLNIDPNDARLPEIAAVIAEVKRIISSFVSQEQQARA